jgi:hypothetical protein
MNGFDNFAYLGENHNPTGFTNNWLEARDNNKLFTQNYMDFPLSGQQTPNDETGAGLYRDILKNQVARTPLSDAFFSMRNIEHLKHFICEQVFKASGNLYRLSPQSQSTNELATVMRSIFTQHAEYLVHDINGQVARLNYQVVSWLIPRVMSNVQQHLTYQRDQSQQVLPMDRPVNVSSAGTRSNRSVTTTFI